MVENGGTGVAQAEQQLQDLSVGNGAIVAVGEARTVLPTPNLSAVKSVDTQTRAIGLIHPPPDIRAIVDKTADFVGRNGLTFEKKILQNEQNNVKFNFLRSTDPYHAYYRFKVAEAQKSVGSEGAPATAAQQQQQADALSAAAQQPADAAAAVAAAAKPLEPPEPDQYTVPTPEGLTAFDLDNIRLTAQFVARNGKAFLTGLAAKEHGNPAFNFLKPTHSLFGFFTALCDAYSKVLMPPKGLMEKLRRNSTDRVALLERCLRRLEFERKKEAEDKAAAEQIEAERAAMQAVDWHDFVVVETIDFYADEDAELPPPMSQRDVILLNKAQQLEDEQEEAAAAADNAGRQEVQMDETERAMLAEANAAANGTVQPPSAAAAAAPDEDVMEIEQEPEPEQIRIVRDYKRPDPKSRAAEAAKYVVSPITGEMVPVDQMAEHMRISLIDPRYQEQRAIMMAKIRETTKASDDEISRNLMGLAKARPDVFGSTQEEVSSIVEASIKDSKISGTDRPVAWDGATTGGQDLQNQVRAIAEQRAEELKRKEPEPVMPKPILGPLPAGSAPAPSTSLPPPPGGPVSLPPPPRPAANPLPPPPVVRPPPQQMAPPQMMRPPPPAMPQYPHQLPQPTAAYPYGMPPGGFPPPQAGAFPPRPPMMMPPPPGAPRPPPPSGPPGGAAPPPLSGAALPPPPPSGGEPEAKRARTDFVLQPEEEFLDAHPGQSKVRVLCPDVEDNEALNGQILEVEVSSLTDSIGDIKARLADVLKLAANKQRISRDGVGVLRDENTLAFYNVGPETMLSLAVRERGGRKK
ncbi:Splicing factor 3A subunit 1 [Coccomyxa sp. Obi]|nr:Splicing factor 3A subunit 1 [Coccomyxa sp. Obi]